MAPLQFKPLRIEAPRYDTSMPCPETQNDPNYHTVITHNFTSSSTDEACNTFTLYDLIMGESVLAGYTTRGDFDIGVITDVKQGWYFAFDGKNEGSKLWNGLLLLRGPLAEAARTRYHSALLRPASDSMAPIPLKRTDTGGNYGSAGYPDLAFWTRSGLQPWYMVMWQDYAGLVETPEELAERIQTIEEYEHQEMTAIENQALRYQLGNLRARLYFAQSKTHPTTPEELIHP